MDPQTGRQGKTNPASLVLSGACHSIEKTNTTTQVPVWVTKLDTAQERERGERELREGVQREHTTRSCKDLYIIFKKEEKWTLWA